MAVVYTKIMDKISFLGDGLSLNMNVMLSSTDVNGNSRPFYSEYQYYSPTVKGQAVTVKREFNYYLTLDKYIRENNNKISVMIRTTDMINFLNCINSATDWFSAKNMFATDNSGKLRLIGEYTPIIINGLAADNTIVLKPTVILSNDKYSTGIQITLNDSCNSDIMIDKFMGMVYLLNKLDMFVSAQAMVNSINQEKGVNRHTFDESKIDLPEPESIIQSGRVISSKNSFFS